MVTPDIEESDDDYSKFSNGYAKDGFVVPDDASDDDFETMVPPRPKARKSRLPMGPPILNDVRMEGAGLDGIHEDILGEFIIEAKVTEEKTRNLRNLRTPIFTEQQLREMAIRWTVSLEQMCLIPGINVDKVNRYGEALLPLIRRYHKQYQQMMGRNDPRAPTAASGSRNVVDLVSTDDEYMDDIDDDDLEPDLGNGGAGAISSYFAPPTSGRAKQAAIGTGVASRARSASSAPKSSKANAWRGSKKTSQRRTSGASSRGGRSSYSGVKKASTSTRKTAAGGSRAKSQGAGFNSIPLMEH